jgi:hypothetical protein
MCMAQVNKFIVVIDIGGRKSKVRSLPTSRRSELALYLPVSSDLGFILPWNCRYNKPTYSTEQVSEFNSLTEANLEAL